MVDFSTIKKGDITFDKNVSYNVVEPSSTGHMGERKSGGGGGGGGGRGGGGGVGGGGGGNNQEYEVISVRDSHLPSQVSGELSLGRGGGGNMTPPHPPPAATSTGGGGGEERVYEEIPGGE